MAEVDAFLTNCRLADGRLVDIGISGRKIAVIGEGAAALSNSTPGIDIGGDLALPGLVDGHMHLDKTLTGLSWMDHAAGPTRMSRIETDKTILPHLPLSTGERAGNLIRECVVRGTTHLRTHVDIDLESGLTAVGAEPAGDRVDIDPKPAQDFLRHPSSPQAHGCVSLIQRRMATLVQRHLFRVLSYATDFRTQ